MKVRYLNLVQNEIAFIQDRIYKTLLPIPEEKEWQMLRTEVPQGLYELLMGTNPSRNIGGANPVDSHHQYYDSDSRLLTPDFFSK